MYSRIVEDNDSVADAQVEVTAGSHVIYVEARYIVSRFEAQDQDQVMLCYDRKQALKLALVLLIAIVRSFRRFR